MKHCFKCGSAINSLLEVCPECRECQPASRRWRWFAVALIVAIFAWVALR